jgi:hypothetical protein
MKTVKVKYTFTSSTTIKVPDHFSEEDIQMEAEAKGQEMEFCLEGMTTMEARVLGEEP